jgi:hypothetical protein
MAEATDGDDRMRRDAADRQRRKRKRDAAGVPALHCGVKTRSGTACRLPAAHGVPGATAGPCARHGGTLPRVRVAAARSELLAEARRWAHDAALDPGEAIYAMVTATAAHAVLVEHRLRELPAGDPDVIAWHRTLDAVQRTAAETAARVIALGLEERQQRMAAEQARWFAAAAERGLAALVAITGAPLTVEARLAFRDGFGDALEAMEREAEVALPA